jgi:hypothetical protein
MSRGERWVNVKEEIMKRNIIITVASLFVLSGWANVAVTASANSSQGKDSISSIRQRYAAINKNLAKYRLVKKELSGFSTEGGELTAYFDGTEIVKIAATFNGETNSWFEEFYYRNGRLMFVFRKQEIYDAPMNKVVKTKENRFYFNNDELIRWINENGKEVAASNSEYPGRRTHYLGSSKLFIEGARSREAMIEGPARTP